MPEETELRFEAAVSQLEKIVESLEARGAGTCHGSDQVRNRRAALEPVLRSAGASRTLGRALDRRGSRGEPGHRLLRRHGDIERRKGRGEPLELACDLQRGGDRTSRSSEAGPRTASPAIGRARAGHPRAAVLIGRRNVPQRRKRRWLSSLPLFLGALRVSAIGNAPVLSPLSRPALHSGTWNTASTHETDTLPRRNA